MKYLNKFANESAYDAHTDGDNYLYPDVSYVEEGRTVHYVDYERMPLTFQIIGEEDYVDGDEYSIELFFDGEDTSYENNIFYRINNGEWTEGNFGNDIIDGLVPGDIVQFKSDSYQAYGYMDQSSNEMYNYFGCNCHINIFGNLASINGWDYDMEDRHYSHLFCECWGLVSAKNLILPYSLGLNTRCFSNMFANCTSLIEAPKLLATGGLASYCYYGMFDGCISLKEAPELPATELESSCYEKMFANCSLLTKAPQLPALSLAMTCYAHMFENCLNLTDAPELPATELTFECYNNMFYGCISLVKAPTLPAQTLVNNCYNSMFRGCTSLNAVTCLATGISATFCTWNWLFNVAPTGIFLKDNDTEWPIGGNGIPANWTVRNYYPERPILRTMWIDEYPVESEVTEAFYGYDDFDDYLDDYVAHPENFGSNEFYYTEETVEYGGNTYYLWYCEDQDFYYATDTISYNYLYSHSIESNHSNRYSPEIYVGSDKNHMYEKGLETDYAHVLVKVDQYGANGYTMWIEDFPSALYEFYSEGWSDADKLDALDEWIYDTDFSYSEYFDLLLNENPGNNYCEADKYCYYGETLEFDGNIYYLWRFVPTIDGDDIPDDLAYALTSTDNYNTLYNMSIEGNSNNRNCPIYTFLNPDKTQSQYVPNYSDERHVLLKVENNEEN